MPVLKCHRTDRPVPVGHLRWILLIHVEEVSHGRPDGPLSRITGFHSHKTPKHLERSTVPVFHDLVVRCKSLVDESAKVLADSLAAMPVADTEIGNGVLLEAIKAFAPRFVVDFSPEREQPIWGAAFGKGPRNHVDILWMSGWNAFACKGNACNRGGRGQCKQSAAS